MISTRTALVTGGTGGLGPATISAFLSAGWRVVAPVRPGTADRLPEGATAVDADLTVEADVRAAARVAASDSGAPLRAVVNLVGGYAGAGLIADTPIADFEAMLTMNLRPTYLTTAAALPYLIEGGGGSVVCVSSRAAVSPFPGAAGYVTAKAAVLAFVQALDADYRSKGIRANAILPSVIDTQANRRDQPDADFSKWVQPAEIARVVRFLVSDDAAVVTGGAIPVYGRA
jgi:NAD(P)-dependent dehydrogenase (short-subunit alcohol dehydrogenase family)